MKPTDDNNTKYVFGDNFHHYLSHFHIERLSQSFITVNVGFAELVNTAYPARHALNQALTMGL